MCEVRQHALQLPQGTLASRLACMRAKCSFRQAAAEPEGFDPVGRNGYSAWGEHFAGEAFDGGGVGASFRVGSVSVMDGETLCFAGNSEIGKYAVGEGHGRRGDYLDACHGFARFVCTT